MDNWKDWIESLKKNQFAALAILILLTIPVTLILVFRSQDTRSSAAAPDKLEAETGTLSSTGVTKESDTQASGGQYVKFEILAYPTPPISTNPTSPPIGSCNIIIPSGTNTIDGYPGIGSIPKGNYANITPGDVVCLSPRSGSSTLTIQNVRGTRSAPITFVNSGGVVGIGKLALYNSEFVRITGSGVQGTKYGIVIQSNNNVMIDLDHTSEEYEIDNLKVVGGSIGVNSKTKVQCNNTWDYNFDGVKDGASKGLDFIHQGTFTQHNTIIHDLRLENQEGEGMYVGSNNSVPGDTYSVCGGNYLNSLLEGTFIYNNHIQDFGADGINVKGAINGVCKIDHNTILRGSTDTTRGNDQTGSIGLGKGSRCSTNGNYLAENRGPGIRDAEGGGGAHINNVIIRPGRGFSSTSDFGAGIRLTGSTYGNVYNNTIIGASSWAISGNKIGRVYNNIGAGLGNSLTQNSPVASGNNLSGTISEMGFIDTESDNYHLISGSTAINAGTDLSSYEVSRDFDGILRPQDSAFDIGAFEYK